MKIIIFFVVGLLLSLNAQAAETKLVNLTSKLATPALWKVDPYVFACTLTNVTSTSHMVRIRIIQDGKILDDSGKISLPAKSTKGKNFETLPGGGYLYCEFTVDGLKGWYRGVAKMYVVDGADFIAVPAE